VGAGTAIESTEAQVKINRHKSAPKILFTKCLLIFIIVSLD